MSFQGLDDCASIPSATPLEVWSYFPEVTSFKKEKNPRKKGEEKKNHLQYLSKIQNKDGRSI